MLRRILNAELAVGRNVLVTYMLGPDADESERMTETELKDEGKASLIDDKTHHLLVLVSWQKPVYIST